MSAMLGDEVLGHTVSRKSDLNLECLFVKPCLFSLIPKLAGQCTPIALLVSPLSDNPDLKIFMCQ